MFKFTILTLFCLGLAKSCLGETSLTPGLLRHGLDSGLPPRNNGSNTGAALLESQPNNTNNAFIDANKKTEEPMITEPDRTGGKGTEVSSVVDADGSKNGSISTEGGLSTTHIVASVAGVCVVVIAVGLAVLLAIHKKRKMDREIMSRNHIDRDNENLPYQNLEPRGDGQPTLVLDKYTNLVEQDSRSCSTIGSLNNISMLPSPDNVSQHSTAVSMPVTSYIPKSRRHINDEVDRSLNRYSCPDWDLSKHQGLINAISQDSGFVSSTHIPTGSRLTIGSNMSSSVFSDLSIGSFDKTNSLKDIKQVTLSQSELLKTRSLKPGMYNQDQAVTLSKLHIPPEYQKSPEDLPESNLAALIEPFLKNPAKFKNRDGTKRTYATMSFAIGAFGSTGGVLSLPNRSVELIIPPHAVEKETVIYFSVVSHSPRNPKEISFGPEVDLGPDGTRFNCPVMLCFQHCSDVNENSSLNYTAMVQESDKPWRELTYDESMCTLIGNRACLFMDHFSRVKLVLKEGSEPDTVSIDENAELDDDKGDDVSVSTIVGVAHTASVADDSSSTICSHNGACACPEGVKQRDRGARPKTLPITKAHSASSSSLESSVAPGEKKKKKGALVKVKRVIQNKLRPVGSFLGKTNGATLNLCLCCFVEKCEHMIKIRVYYAATQGIIDDIVIKEHGNQSTAPCSFMFRQGQGSLKFKLDTTHLEMYWPSQTAFEGLSEEHILCNHYDHVEFAVKPTSATVGLVKVFQSKRPHEKRKLNPTWGNIESKALQAKHWMQCIDTENNDIVSHMLATRGVEPVEMVPRKPAIPYRLMMELSKILDPDERSRASLADSIGVDYGEAKWIQSRKASYTKVILTFFQGLFYKESSDELLRRLFVHFKEIKHDQAADIVFEYLRGTSRLRGNSSSSHSSSENDVNNSFSSNQGRKPPRPDRCDSNYSTNSMASSISSINTSSSTINHYGGSNRNRNLSDADSGYSPSPSSPPVTTSSVRPGVHIPVYTGDSVSYKVMKSGHPRGVLSTPL